MNIIGMLILKWLLKNWGCESVDTHGSQ
jgi:hypothetical protein